MEEQITLKPEELEFAANLWGFSEEEKETILPNLNSYQKRYIRHWPDFFKYKIIQEVVWAKKCAEMSKEGDQIVYSGIGEFLPDESTFGCTFAIQTALPLMHVIQERILSGQDPTPVGLNLVRCIDTPPERGGSGATLTKLYCIESKWELPEGVYRPGVKEYIDSISTRD